MDIIEHCLRGNRYLNIFQQHIDVIRAAARNEGVSVTEADLTVLEEEGDRRYQRPTSGELCLLIPQRGRAATNPRSARANEVQNGERYATAVRVRGTTAGGHGGTTFVGNLSPE